MSPMIGTLTVFSGYLLGSIPSAYLIGRLRGIDLTLQDGDSKLGTSLSFRKLGPLAGLVVALMDFGKGTIAVAAARVLDVPITLLLLAGFAAVAGHNWSLFLGFKGGRGAMVTYGVLASLALWGLLISTFLAGIFFFFTRRSTLATVVLLSVLPIILGIQGSFHFPPALPWEQEITPWLVMFPLSLIVPNLLKYMQTQKRPVKGKAHRFHRLNKKVAIKVLR